MRSTSCALLLLLGSAFLRPSISYAQTIFQDDFSAGKLNSDKWTVATYKSPDSKPGINNGTYILPALNFDQGMLRITVQQTKSANAVDSTGGAIVSRQRFGFGTYVFEMRMSSPSSTPDGKGKASSGAISSGFLYFNK